MTKINSFKSLLLIGILSSSLAATLFPSHQAAPPHAAKIGDFNLPALSGWKQKVIHRDPIHQAAYSKDIKGNKLSLTLTWLKVKNQKPSQEIREMQNKIKKSGGGIAFYTRSRGGTLVKTKHGPEQITSLNGIPAVLEYDLFTSSRGVGSWKRMHFAHKDKRYLLMATISSRTPSLSSQAKAESERAWETITKSLKP